MPEILSGLISVQIVCKGNQSAHDTSKYDDNSSKLESDFGIYIKLKEHQTFAC